MQATRFMTSLSLPLIFTVNAAQAQQLEEYSVRPNAGAISNVFLNVAPPSKVEKEEEASVYYSQWSTSASLHDRIRDNGLEVSALDQEISFQPERSDELFGAKTKKSLERKAKQYVGEVLPVNLDIDTSEKSVGYSIGSFKLLWAREVGDSFAKDFKKQLRRTALRGEERPPGLDDSGFAITYKYEF